jgi:tRNA nucleotidyltransferase (CCA-adding enzyme)
MRGERRAGGAFPVPEPVRRIAETLEAAQYEAWCVGGALRDWRLAPDAPLEHDVDLATSARPEEVTALFRRTIPVGARFGTVGVLDPAGRLHEVTTFRKDVRTDGRHAVVEYGVSLEEDLHRRDFTINALAYHPIREEWRDPENGAADLAARVLRAVGEPERRFAEDYLRVLRLLRFAARLGFRIDPATWTAAQAAAPGLTRLSAERVRDEWFKGLRTARSLPGFAALWQEAGAATVLLPELRQPCPLPDQPPPRPLDPVVATAALCERPAPVLRRLRASNAEIARAEALARGPAGPSGLDPGAVRRWLAEVGDAADDLLALAELASGVLAPQRPVVAGIRARGEPVDRSQLAVSGEDLLAAGVPAGPELGRVLARLLDAVLARPELNTREGLLALVRQWS